MKNPKPKYDENGMRLQVWNRAEGNDLAPITGDDATAALIEMGMQTLRTNPRYDNDQKGFEDFQRRTLDYFQYIQNVNADKEAEKKLMCDIESWCVYMGITRKTLLNYQTRNDEWKAFIDKVKELILTTKKVRAYSHQAPPIFAIFDFVNNHGYRNTNDIRIEAEPPTGLQPQRSPEEIAKIIEADIPIDDRG